MPVLGGSELNSAVQASSPPALAPIPTTMNGGSGRRSASRSAAAAGAGTLAETVAAEAEAEAEAAEAEAAAPSPSGTFAEVRAAATRRIGASPTADRRRFGGLDSGSPAGRPPARGAAARTDLSPGRFAPRFRFAMTRQPAR